MLKGLWLEIANLKAATTMPASGQTSARVQALCAKIAAAHPGATRAVDDDSPTLAR
jgi:hypothetical protein